MDSPHRLRDVATMRSLLSTSKRRPYMAGCTLRTSGHVRRRLPTRFDDPSSEEPAQSHLKLTIVDGEYTVLGSGNMDRASWYTSQELGVLFEDKEFASLVRASTREALRSRLHVVFDSDVDE